MKTLIYVLIFVGFGWVILEPKDVVNPVHLPLELLNYKQAEIPDSLKVVDKLIIEIEKDLYYEN